MRLLYAARLCQGTHCNSLNPRRGTVFGLYGYDFEGLVIPGAGFGPATLLVTLKAISGASPVGSNGE